MLYSNLMLVILRIEFSVIDGNLLDKILEKLTQEKESSPRFHIAFQICKICVPCCVYACIVMCSCACVYVIASCCSD